MLLAIDIGNTRTHFGVFEGGKLKSEFTITTQPSRTPDEVTLQLKALAKTRKLHLRRAKDIVVCSVVPRMTSLLLQSLASLGKMPIRIVGKDIEVPLVNRYTYPEQVGQDRLVGAYAAWKKAGGECIVADFGTALTIDVVSRKGEYLGGIIAPGLEISLEALATRTALLPKVELCEPPELLGRDTANSIRSGVVFGCVALCEGLILRLKQSYVPHAHVIATGGAGKIIANHSPIIEAWRPNLVLEGLAQLAKLREKPKTPTTPPKRKRSRIQA